MERVLADVRYAIRVWARSPAFTAVALLTVGIGIGAAIAIFGQMNAVFWTPLPVERPAELRLLAWTAPRHPFASPDQPTPRPGRDRRIIRAQVRSGHVVAFSAVCTHRGCTVAPGDDALECPCHGSTYDLTTGENTGGPAPRPLAVLPVRVVDGVVEEA